MEIPKFPELTFDEGTHIYRLRGAELPSVTTVMKPLSSEVYGGVDEWVMERAAGRGTAVHNAIENWSLYGIEDIAPEYRGYFDGFLAWVQDMKPTVLGNECRLYHKALRYQTTSSSEGKPSSYPDKSVEVSQRERAVTSSARIEVALDG